MSDTPTDLASILDARQTAAPEPVAPAEVAAAPEPVAAEPAPAPAPAPAPVVPVPPQPEKPAEPTVPLSAMLAMRDELKALKSRLGEMQKPAQPEPAPDVITDPEAWQRHQQAQFDARLNNERLNLSEAMAREQFGDDKVDAAFGALIVDGQVKDAAEYQRIMASRSPYHELVRWHARQQAMAQIGPDPVKWAEAERERIRREVEAEMAAKQVRAAPPAPPPSLSSTTSAPPSAVAYQRPDLSSIIGR